MIYLPWAVEFVLECSGAYLTFRKRLKILSALLAWRAFMDLVTFAIFIAAPEQYAVVMWLGRAVQYAILYALGIQLAAKMVADYRPLTQYVYKTLAVVSSVATYVFVSTELWEHKFSRAEAVTSFLLLAVVLLGWIGRKKGLEEPWRLFALGLILSAAGNAFCSILSIWTPNALAMYPIPAILALLIWNLAAIYRKKEPMRLELPPKIEPTGVYQELSSRVQ